MKQVYLHRRGARHAELRSDTLLGLIAWGVRTVFGRVSVERFLADPPVLTSAFPWRHEGDRRVHFFPRPFECRTTATRSRYVREEDFVRFVAGERGPFADAAVVAEDSDVLADGGGAPRSDGRFFFADGPNVHYVEPALAFLERFGFGAAAFDAETIEIEFLRRARAGETALLLSLWSPTTEERAQLARDAERAGSRVSYAVERRQGLVGGGLLALERVRKRAVIQVAEGSLLRCPESPGRDGEAPRPGAWLPVGTADDGSGPFTVMHPGHAFLVPVQDGPALQESGASEAVSGVGGVP